MIAANQMQLGAGSQTLDRNQVQLALAIADGGLLRSLLTNCTVAIAHPQQIGQLRVSIGPPPNTEDLEAIDAVLDYEHVWCIPSAGAPDIGPSSVREYHYLTRCQSGLQTLAWRVNLAEAIALLQHGGLHEDQIQRILQLPWDGWHRSWWDMFNAQGQLELPFQRWFRTRCYSDGTYTLQYRDHYSQDAPPCFSGIWESVPMMITAPGQPFGDTLAGLRKARHALSASRCLLLADHLSEIEVEGYIRQGVSLYDLAHSHLLHQPLCQRCGCDHCPMQTYQQTPVVACRDYTPLANIL